MTPFDTLSLRDLDALVAQRLFGMKIHRGRHDVYVMPPGQTHMIHERPLPFYTISLAEAMTVVTRLRALDFGVTLVSRGSWEEGEHFCEIDRPGWTASVVERAVVYEALPTAICRAALEAIRSHQEDGC